MATKQLDAEQATECVPCCACSVACHVTMMACHVLALTAVLQVRAQAQGRHQPQPRLQKGAEGVREGRRPPPPLPAPAVFARFSHEGGGAQVILGDGAVVCGLPVIFESACEKKGGGPDGESKRLSP